MSSSDKSRATILNVNDSEASRYMITRLLDRAGLPVMEARSGTEALDMIRAHRPRLVVLDVKLPDIDGLEVCRRVKADSQLQSIKILHTSAVFVNSEYKVQSLECGADGYLTFPFEQEELVAIIRSLLRLTDAEQELRTRADELRAVNLRTNEFLAMLAHELRNPLATIVACLPLLGRREGVDGKECTARELIKRQTGNLSRLVDDLLDVARVTQGKIDLRWEPVDLSVLLQRVCVSLQQTRTNDRRQALHTSLPQHPVLVRGDQTRLEQVFSNLLDNASKYTDEGGTILVELQRVPARAANELGSASITVRDSGIGMSPETINTIFDLFSQADVPLSRSRGGLGIGLTLVRTLVERHGGEVIAHSDGVGQGSEFQVMLPLLSAVSVTPGSTQPQLVQKMENGRKVLLIEDNVDAQAALKSLLEMWGHEVVVASDGLVGITTALAIQPDIALVDIGLPTVDGYEVARQLRKIMPDRRPLLVALTGYGAAEQKAKAMEAGFDLHVVKPVEPEHLAKLIEDCRPGKVAVPGR